MDRARTRNRDRLTEPILAEDFRAEPWWWHAAPRPREAPAPLPAETDAVIVGSGYTGLSCALTLARGGRDVAVLEADVPGFGASSRNAGFVGKVCKHGLGELADALGESKAVAIYRELGAAWDYVAELVEHEQIACHFTRCGRFVATATAKQYEALARDLELKERLLGEPFEMVPHAEQRREIGSERFRGGAVMPSLGSIHPGLYHLGLLERVRNAGAAVFGSTRVTGVRRERGGFEVRTARGTVRAREVIVATNGYTGRATPWQYRRVVPFRGFMIATEKLSTEQLERALPGHRTYHDYVNNIDFLRRAPDEPRILFGGLTGTMTDDLALMGARLRARLVATFPELEGVRLSRAWSGYCAGTFDLWPHIGVEDGIHYAMRYCYAGLPMGTWLGHKVAAHILGRNDRRTAFAERPFPTRFGFRGGSWPVPLAMAWYNFQDWRSMRE